MLTYVCIYWSDWYENEKTESDTEWQLTVIYSNRVRVKEDNEETNHIQQEKHTAVNWGDGRNTHQMTRGGQQQMRKDEMRNSGAEVLISWDDEGNGEAAQLWFQSGGNNYAGRTPTTPYRTIVENPTTPYQTIVGPPCHSILDHSKDHSYTEL